jgi:hypothetical protein
VSRRDGPPPSAGEPDDVELVVEVVQEHPADGVYADGYWPPPGPPRRGPQLAGALVVLVALVAIVYVVITSTPSAEQAGRGRTPATSPFSLPSVESGSIRPTMVAPGQMPGELHLVEGAADRSGFGDDRLMLIVWSASKGEAIEVLGETGCRERSHALADRAVAVAQARRDPESDIRWCEDGLQFTVIAGPSTEAEVAALVVATVRFDLTAAGPQATAGTATAGTVTAPTGFEVIPGEPRGERVLLRYAAAASGPQVTVLVQGGDRWSLDRYAAQSVLNGGWRGPRTPIGPSPGYIVEQPSSTEVHLQYDEHTMVSITGEGLSGDEMRRLAASLADADPSLAPLVSPAQLTRRSMQR